MLDNFRVRVSSLGPAPLRIALGIVFITHGWGKFQQLLDGVNPVLATVQNLPSPYPEILGWAAGLTEFVGGICVLLGLLTRFWSAGLVIQMAVALATVHVPMWVKAQESQPAPTQAAATAPADAAAAKPPAGPSKRGVPGLVNEVQLPLSLGLIALGLFLLGPGPLSIDYWLGRKIRGPNANAVVSCGTRYPAAILHHSANQPPGQPGRSA